ncbi:hypothetical protein BEWA_051370 [Theileria equi strain WA]|uniref:Uncharacterized protein n=1 Tax=Theileria equi strain WA TaxID=1537102 RepID=L1LCV5_THEEQ|nr:hypothetical protein BEWA_051370 [Theileria equi strain WA]EKX73085.1 hypothetical protein BEWA_051370 [Theileria equi strain WA]|eukprot:XP_004832537.1 hypothetical protein BEWA_051370 [Theileria equi strain WA]
MDKIANILNNSPTIEDYLPKNWNVIRKTRKEPLNDDGDTDLLIPSFEHCLRKNLDNKVKDFREQIKKAPQHKDLISRTKVPLLHHRDTSAKLVPDSFYSTNERTINRNYNDVINELEADDYDLYRLHREACTVFNDTHDACAETSSAPEELPIPSIIAARTIRAIINLRCSQHSVDRRSDRLSPEDTAVPITKSDTFKFNNSQIMTQIIEKSESIPSNTNRSSPRSEKSNITSSDLESVKGLEEEDTITSNVEIDCSPASNDAISHASDDDTHNKTDSAHEDVINEDLFTPTNVVDAVYEESVSDSQSSHHSNLSEEHSDVESDLCINKEELDAIVNDIIDELETSNSASFKNDATSDNELEVGAETSKLDVEVDCETVQESGFKEDASDPGRDDSTSDINAEDESVEVGLDLEQNQEILENNPEISDTIQCDDQEALSSNNEDTPEIKNIENTSSSEYELDDRTEIDNIPEGGNESDSPECKEEIKESESEEEKNEICILGLKDTPSPVNSENEAESSISDIFPISHETSSRDCEPNERSSDNSPALEVSLPLFLSDESVSEQDFDDTAMEPITELEVEQTTMDHIYEHVSIYSDSKHSTPKSYVQSSTDVSEDEAITEGHMEEMVDVPSSDKHEIDEPLEDGVCMEETVVSDQVSLNDAPIGSEHTEESSDALEDDSLINEINDNIMSEENINSSQSSPNTNYDATKNISEDLDVLSNYDSDSDLELDSSVYSDKDSNDSESLHLYFSDMELEGSNNHKEDPLEPESESPGFYDSPSGEELEN